MTAMTTVIFWIVFISAVWTSARLFSIVNISAGAATTSNTSLACFDCSETFKQVWEPYTVCQAYPTSTPLRECLTVERYCKVERTKYRAMTVSITRACTTECIHGCYASGFGLTKLKCTSCCQERGCNVDSAIGRVSGSAAMAAVCAVLALLC